MGRGDDFLYKPPPASTFDEKEFEFDDSKWGAGSSWDSPQQQSEWQPAPSNTQHHANTAPQLAGLNQPMPGAPARRAAPVPQSEGSPMTACAAQIGLASTFGVLMGCASGAILGPMLECSPPLVFAQSCHACVVEFVHQHSIVARTLLRGHRKGTEW